MTNQTKPRTDWALWMIAGGAVVAAIGFFNAVDDGMQAWEGVALLVGAVVGVGGVVTQALTRRRP